MHYTNTEELSDGTFLDYFENRIQDTISQFNLFSKDDALFVAASGGKDSTVLLSVLKKLGYDVQALTVNAHIGCYSDKSLEHLRNFCTKEDIPLHVITLQEEFGHSLCTIMALMEEKGYQKTSCSICGTLRRYLLNKHGKRLGAKIVLTGHNLDDEAEAIMMALFAGNPKQIARIGPLANLSGTFVKRAKPMYFISEDEVIRYSKIKRFDVHYGWCPCSVKASRRFYAELDITPEKKFNVVRNIITQLPKLRLHFKSTELRHCSLCEEPSSNEICQTCTILNTVKDRPIKKTRLVVLNEEQAVCES